MKHRTRGSWVLSMVSALIACSDGTPSMVTVADSAGITVVTNLTGELESAALWSLSPEPVLEISGGANPDVPLFHVTALAPLDNGGVAVGMNTPPHALVFDSEGTLIATMGKEGDGPGEFSSVISVVPLSADSIAVWDPDRRRMSVFASDAQFGRDVDFSAIVPVPAWAAVGTDSASGFSHLLPSSAGSVVVFGEGAVTAGSEPQVMRPEMPSHRVRTDGELVATIEPIAGMEVLIGGPSSPMPVPFGARTYAASMGGDLVVGTAATTEVGIYDTTGVLVRIVRWPDSPREVAGPFLTNWAGMVSEWSGGRAAAEALVESVPRAERFPAYQDIVVTEPGEIMVGEYPGPIGVWPMRRGEDGPALLRPMIRMPARNWLVFDATGVLIATVSTPEGFEPYASRGGHLWGVYTDELDIESVRAYEVLRR